MNIGFFIVGGLIFSNIYGFNHMEYYLLKSETKRRKLSRQ